MSVQRDLLRAEWTTRPRAYMTLLALLAATSGTLFLVLASIGGLQNEVGQELSDTLGGDARLTRGRTGLGDGDVMTDERNVLAGLAYYAPAARVSPRLETEVILLHGQDFTTDTNQPVTRAAAVIVGVDPAADANVSGLDRYRDRGASLSDPAVYRYRTPAGETVVPLVVGSAFLDTTHVTVANGTFSWSSVYNFTAGRSEGGELVRAKGIVVGTYSTGFRMIDRLVVYAPRGDVARLLGYFPSNPPSNVILVAGDLTGVDAVARSQNLTLLAAAPFRESYLGPVFTAVRATAWVIAVAITLMTAGWIAHTLSHHVLEDRHKIATLRAIGIPSAAFVRVYLALGALLGLGGAIVGLFAAALLAFFGQPLVASLGVPAPSTSGIELAFLLALSLSSGVGAAGWAVRKAARLSVREALARP